MNDSNCSSKDSLYIITCKYCTSYYIGHSICVKKRLKGHIRAVRFNRTSSNCVCVHRHFNSLNHNTVNDFIFNIFNVNLSNKFKRLTLETHLIHLFLKCGALLINDFIPNLYYTFPNTNLFVK